MGFGNKKNAKKIKIDLKKGKTLEMIWLILFHVLCVDTLTFNQSSDIISTSKLFTI